MPVLDLDSDPYIQISVRFANKLPLFQPPATAEAVLRTPVMKEPCLFYCILLMSVTSAFDIKCFSLFVSKFARFFEQIHKLLKIKLCDSSFLCPKLRRKCYKSFLLQYSMQNLYCVQILMPFGHIYLPCICVCIQVFGQQTCCKLLHNAVSTWFSVEQMFTVCCCFFRHVSLCCIGTIAWESGRTTAL